MLINRKEKIRSSEITKESIFRDRRNLVKAGISMGIIPSIITNIISTGHGFPNSGQISNISTWQESSDEKLTPYEHVTNYNNFYEFGTGKDDPAKNAHSLKTRPWSITIDGEVEKKGTFDFEDLVDLNALEERIYRFRCVEAWSMVIPWVGFPLKKLIDYLNPNSNAKYIQFFTLNDPNQMPGVRYRSLQWPYREGLTIEEAINPLSFIAVGVYGEVLPNQNGAPIRLVVPWKYGFKSIKSIVRINFTREMPQTTWKTANYREYGFYSNVNPEVSHPRWSQAYERKIGEGLFSAKVPTQLFNGYQEEVSYLYKNLDLKLNY